jgi:CRISPR-associated protein Cas2
MMMLVTYDVSTATSSGKARLRRVAKACKDYGQRVQYSVFEIELEPADWVNLRNILISEIDPAHDSLRFYHLGKNWRPKVEHIGAKPATDFGGPLII